MRDCAACGTPLPEESRFCPACAAPVPASQPTVDGETLVAGGAAPPPRRGPSSPMPSPPAEEERFVPGTMIAGRYRIGGLLGRGGMGEVYRADDLVLGETVALKFLPPQLESDAAALERFRGEVRTARRITHPNVCRVFDLGEVDGRVFLSMEYIDGEDLASLLRRIGRLPSDKGLQVARQLCAGLAAAHEQGVLHRDLKPANVMIDGRGRAKITDFGLAGVEAEMGRGAAREGTPAYMAPEQLAGREVTARSDIYALGLVLYELFTGRRAFVAADRSELMRLQQTTRPQPSGDGGRRRSTRWSRRRCCVASSPTPPTARRRPSRWRRCSPVAIHWPPRWPPVRHRRRRWWRRRRRRASSACRSPPAPWSWRCSGCSSSPASTSASRTSCRSATGHRRSWSSGRGRWRPRCSGRLPAAARATRSTTGAWWSG